MTTSPCHLRRYLRAREAALQERLAQRAERQHCMRHAQRMHDGTPGDDCIPLGWLLALAVVAAVVVWLVLGAWAS